MFDGSAYHLHDDDAVANQECGCRCASGPSQSQICSLVPQLCPARWSIIPQVTLSSFLQSIALRNLVCLVCSDTQVITLRIIAHYAYDGTRWFHILEHRSFPHASNPLSKILVTFVEIVNSSLDFLINATSLVDAATPVVKVTTSIVNTWTQQQSDLQRIIHAHHSTKPSGESGFQSDRVCIMDSL